MVLVLVLVLVRRMGLVLVPPLMLLGDVGLKVMLVPSTRNVTSAGLYDAL